MFKRLVVPRLIKMRFYRYCLSYFPRNRTPSDKPISVVIPLALKDIYRAGICVRSIRKHVKHPITNIIIVGQDRDEIRDFCRENELTYINENNVLPAAALNGEGVLKPNGWVRQQLIKLSVFNFIDADNILIHDSDTYFMRDVTFFSGNRQILFLADEYTRSYEKLLFDFLGPITRYHRSFVTHSMLLQCYLFERLNNKVIENYGLPLIDAIIKNIEIANSGKLSEFETYGNFLNSFHKDSFETRYWYNRKIPPDTKLPLEELEARFKNLNSVSAHEH